MAPYNEDMETFSSAAVMETDVVPVISGSGDRDNTGELPKSILDYYINIEKVPYTVANYF